jgi:hypothetical protein
MDQGSAKGKYMSLAFRIADEQQPKRRDRDFATRPMA